MHVDRLLHIGTAARVLQLSRTLQVCPRPHLQALSLGFSVWIS